MLCLFIQQVGPWPILKPEWLQNRSALSEAMRSPWPSMTSHGHLKGLIKNTKNAADAVFFGIKWWIHQEIQFRSSIQQIQDLINHQPSTINPPSTIKPPTFQMISPSQLPMPPNPLDPLALPGVIVNGSGLFKGSWRRCHGLIHRAKRTPLNYRKKRQKDRKVDLKHLDRD